MSAGQAPRRRNHVDMPVAYAAVGASRAPDLMRFPPTGSTPYEHELRLGSGQERFLLASSLLMTWGAQRGSGLSVQETERGTGAAYFSPSFDDAGTPQAPGDLEEHFGPEGDPYVVAGTTAILSTPGKSDREILVVYTVSEPRRVGFAWGTSDEEGPIGEQLFAVELREDDTVWAISRGFLSAPKSGLLGLRARAELRLAVDAVRRQLASLAPGAQPIGFDPVAAQEAAAAEPSPDLVIAATDSGPTGDTGTPAETETDAEQPASDGSAAEAESADADADLHADVAAAGAEESAADLAAEPDAAAADSAAAGVDAQAEADSDVDDDADSGVYADADAKVDGDPKAASEPAPDADADAEVEAEADPESNAAAAVTPTDQESDESANQRVTHKRRPGAPRA